mmetsp:Transcript_15045/g.21103  ORF Transcript_15045/g.21103 Transcript_15045/m.21103 type:complete len:114 (-) Transcript_15045:123-464(-)
MLRLMKLEEPRRDIVIRSPRYGLTLKRDPKPKEKWIMAPYRTQAQPEMSCEELKKLSGVKEKQHEKNLAIFNKGQILRSLSSFHGLSLKSSDLLRMYGAWTFLYGRDFPCGCL